MSALGYLAEQIAEALRSRATHDQIPSIARSAGLLIPEAGNGVSKRDRVHQALAGKSDCELAEIARRLGFQFGDFGLEEAGLTVLENESPPITEITRRDVARCFAYDLNGEQNLLALLRKCFNIDILDGNFLFGSNLACEIEQHMILNPRDWNVEYLFEQIGALNCSRDRFGRLVEAALHPLSRRGPKQLTMAESLNTVLQRDGYHLRVDGEESGYPIYRLCPNSRGSSGVPKNLIFASNGPKPEIGFGDAINNDIVILSNASSCLVYDRPFSRDGLLWSELIEWWRLYERNGSADPAQTLGLRLRASLANSGERKLFESYFSFIGAS